MSLPAPPSCDSATEVDEHLGCWKIFSVHFAGKGFGPFGIITSVWGPRTAIKNIQTCSNHHFCSV